METVSFQVSVAEKDSLLAGEEIAVPCYSRGSLLMSLAVGLRQPHRLACLADRAAARLY
jgi:hypothetical protein